MTNIYNFRLLLRVQELQDDILDLIFEEITKDVTEPQTDTSWLRLLLNSLRYITQIKDPESVCTKLLDILEVSSLASQLEILDAIPEIIPDSQYRKTAEELCRILNDSEDTLSGAIIDCLNALNLECDIRTVVKERILSSIVAGTSLKMFPMLLEFLLTDNKSGIASHLFQSVRDTLNTSMPSESEEDPSHKIFIFQKIESYCRKSKATTDGWINMIQNIKEHNATKPIDLLLLFMVHTTIKSKRKVIEAIIKKKISSGIFRIKLLENVFTNYIPEQLFKDYFTSMLQIGCHLLKFPNDLVVTEFAITMFKIIFSHKYTEIILRRELLDSLILISGTLNSNTSACIVLKLMSYFLEDISTLQCHTTQLMLLMEKLDIYQLNDVKQVFEILCALTCGEHADEAVSGIKDEIHIIVRKQLSSSKRTIKHRGIVSAVVMAKHLAITSEDQSELSISDESLISIASLPAGKARDAAVLLELATASCASSADLMGLFYDQLASMLITTKYLDRHFMGWLYETITDCFQNKYVTEILPDKIMGLKFSMQYELNSREELETPLGINIGRLTMDMESTDSILLLAPHFRLLRLLHYRQQNGDLSSIDALLGCAVVMPVVEDLEDLNLEQIKQVSSCLFHCVNWFREIISAFVTQDSQMLRTKVLKRLQNLIDLELMLLEYVGKVPDYKLPVSYFDSVSQMTRQKSPLRERKPINPRKKQKTSETVIDNDTTMGSVANTQSAPTQRGRPGAKKQSGDHAISFREVDTDVIKLLKYTLKSNGEANSQDEGFHLNIHQLKFILKDFASKLSVLTKGKERGLSHLNAVAPINMIRDCVKILPKIKKHLETVTEELNELLKESDGRPDLPIMYTEEAINVKTCFGLIIECLFYIFGWPGFQNTKNSDLLAKLIKSFDATETQSYNSVKGLVTVFIQILSGYTDQCLDIQHAVYLIKTIEVLSNTIDPATDVKKMIITTSSKLLSKRWYNSKGVLHTGKECNAAIDVLVKNYLNNANLRTLCGLIGTMQEEVPVLKQKEDCLHMLASIDKQNFHIFYMNICLALHNRVKIDVQSLTNQQHLELWNNVALAMQGLMSVAKMQETKNNLTSFLKKSIAILKTFMSHGIPILEIALRHNPDEVLVIFKTMQTSTRFLHHLCCYSKLTKDTGIMSYVPQFRLILETLIYRVKAALVANNCSAAFWMGNLRNRDLQGEDIISQSTVISEQNDQEDEELPDDVFHESDEEVRSESEVF